MKLGQLKDTLSLPFFLVILYKLYFLRINNLELIKKELIIYLSIAFFTDFIFSIFTKMHCVNLNLNYSTYFFMFIIVIVLYTFIYSNFL